MNRIILIGNGFDLAHGLKTSYRNFIDDYWQKAIKNIISRESIKKFYYDDENIHFSVSSNKRIEDFYDPVVFRHNIRYKNDFLRTITEQCYSNWVDIEEEYFTQLKYIIKTNGDTIKKLNDDFDKIKKALEAYLVNELDNVDPDRFNIQNIMQNFNIADFSSDGISALRKEYSPETEKEKIKYDRQLERYFYQAESGGYSFYETQIYPNRTLLLNFNYTDLPQRLIRYIHDNAWKFDSWAENSFECISIHGKLKNKDYPIIFGYGDEQDEVHKEIEKRGGEYLDNIKTINYLKTQNYKSMLNFIEAGLYQVFIWGHSCGLSDKTLLNTLFTHDNCVSIKPFYYIDENGHNNYDDIVKNIYRCFTDKALMREKVVNESFCEPLT
jgi:hypothetical protein